MKGGVSLLITAIKWKGMAFEHHFLAAVLQPWALDSVPLSEASSWVRCRAEFSIESASQSCPVLRTQRTQHHAEVLSVLSEAPDSGAVLQVRWPRLRHRWVRREPRERALNTLCFRRGFPLRFKNDHSQINHASGMHIWMTFFFKILGIDYCKKIKIKVS